MHAFFAAQIEPLVADSVALAVTRSVLIQEVLFVLGAVFTLVGVMAQWQLPRRRMSMEERNKDGLITEDNARLRIRLNAGLAPSFTIAGAVLMVGATWGWF